MTANPDINWLDIPEMVNELARRSLLQFTVETKEDYIVNWHHRLICDYLDRFVTGEITHLMIFMPPQTGKSELASRRLPAYILGKYPNTRIAIASFSQGKARSFNRECQRIIDSKRYSEIFPDTKLYSGGNGNGKNARIRTTDEFEIVSHEGKLIVTGIRGALTGEKVDILIADDLVKDKVEAISPTIQLRNKEWWDNVAMTRLHNESKVLLLMTRWDKGDLPGRLMTDMRTGKCQKYTVLTLPSIKEVNGNPDDPREIGDVLWPERHSLERILQRKQSNPAAFRALDQQDPSVDPEYKIFIGWEEIKEMPGHGKFYGLDFGFTNNPTAVVECQHHNGKGYVKEILYKTGLTNQQIAKNLKSLGINHEIVVCDGAEPKSIEELRQSGINAVASIKGQGSVNTQILFIQNLKMHYVPARGNLEFELDNYQWMQGPDGPINQEVDKYNHLMKAIMYAFYKQCHSVTPGVAFF